MGPRNDAPPDGFPHCAYISVGSNMGERLALCKQGIAFTCGHPGIHCLAVSPFYETEPVDFTDQAWFVNAVFKIGTKLSPVELLTHLKSVQTMVGRAKGAVRFGPRVLDLDILLYDDLILETDDLTIPHPRMHKRRFVLLPMCDIDPNVRHPIKNCSIHHLFVNLNAENQAIRQIDV